MNTQAILPQTTPAAAMIRTLGLIAAICGLIIVVAYQGTYDAVQENKRIAVERAVFKVIPAAKSIVEYAALPAGDLVRTVKGADKANVVAVRLFDDFRGAGVPEGKKSLAVEVTLQPGEKSYDEAELKAIAERVTAAAAKLGAVLRG